MHINHHMGGFLQIEKAQHIGSQTAAERLPPTNYRTKCKRNRSMALHSRCPISDSEAVPRNLSAESNLFHSPDSSSPRLIWFRYNPAHRHQTKQIYKIRLNKATAGAAASSILRDHPFSLCPSLHSLGISIIDDHSKMQTVDPHQHCSTEEIPKGVGTTFNATK